MLFKGYVALNSDREILASSEKKLLDIINKLFIWLK